MIKEQLTENFSIKEWKCHDGTNVPYNLVENVQYCADNLQALRDKVGKPISVISGYRNPSYNKKINGATRSYHMTGLAADIKVTGMKPAEVASIIEDLITSGKMKQGGLGTYKKFTHYDCRGTKARWNG